ncbi:hypothetical protein T05_1883 [Trichinella murrelli]|uniref:Uncharacterized protein n=1 Tax=Trichinella murrelli TaxID=144512 RepID=A0A0V0SYB4_9BILA|nr:hypothetical protein T05_1883 [Trichinella murrelli]
MWLTARLFGLRLSCTVRGIAQPSRFPNYFSMIWVARRGSRFSTAISLLLLTVHLNKPILRQIRCR